MSSEDSSPSNDAATISTIDISDSPESVITDIPSSVITISDSMESSDNTKQANNQNEQSEQSETQNPVLPPDHFYVERLNQKRIGPDTSELEYEVKWADYPESQNTFETLDNIVGSLPALLQFENKQSGQVKKFTPSVLDEQRAIKLRAEVVAKAELIEVVAFIPDEGKFVVKYDDQSMVILKSSEYSNLPPKKKKMFVDFLLRTKQQYTQPVIDYYVKRKKSKVTSDSSSIPYHPK